MSWMNSRPKTLRKVVYALNEHKLHKNIIAHEERGWKQASEIKEYRYGLGILMEFPQRGKEVSV
jgi:hypothetical protein